MPGSRATGAANTDQTAAGSDDAVTWTVVVAFAGLCLLLAVTPGPDTFLVLRFGITSVRSGAAAAVGCGLGSLCWAAAVALGLAAVLASSAWAFTAVKIAGGLYLLYLGVSGFVHRGAAARSAGPPVRTGAALRSGLFSCLLNPKVGLFFLAVAPQFLPAGNVHVGTVMVLGLIDGVIAVAWLVAMAFAAARVVSWLRRPAVTRTLDGVSSAVLALLGIGTLVTIW
jgi:threonine/homoserine/homoserine lactone efflux protein